VDQRFCDKIGADAYTRDAATAAEVAAAFAKE
jgi:methanogenic corrinoid protein MtbC1